MKKLATEKLIYHITPNHGYVEYPIDWLYSMGLELKDFSRHSYKTHDNYKIYLEEDTDAGILIKKLNELGKQVQLIEKFHDTDITDMLDHNE